MKSLNVLSFKYAPMCLETHRISLETRMCDSDIQSRDIVLILEKVWTRYQN